MCRPMSTWADRISDLRAGGLQLKDISQRTGMAISTVSDIANGRIRQPGGDAALALHALHLELCGQRKGRKRAAV